MDPLAWTTEPTGATAALPWLGTAIAVLTVLFGTGGVVAFYKARHDAAQGVAQHEVVADDSIANRWKAIIEAQTISLLDPMQRRLKEVEGKVSTLETELAGARRKYWVAISHIRTMYAWISRHLPEEVEQTQIPAPPATLVDDI